MTALRIVSKSFENLSNTELYEILALRQEVFIVEQSCIYADADFKDQYAHHCMAFDEDNRLVAYTRLFEYQKIYPDYTTIGRVVGSPRARGKGYGREILAYSIKEIKSIFGNYPIKIGAQAYLERFYNSFGFLSTGEDYLEDGIPHKYMVLNV